MTEKEKIANISNDYQEFVKVAEEVTERDVSLYPLLKHESKRDRYERHIIDMLSMYQSRYGVAENPYKSAWQALNSISKLGQTPEQERMIRSQLEAIELEFRIVTAEAPQLREAAEINKNKEIEGGIIEGNS